MENILKTVKYEKLKKNRLSIEIAPCGKQYNKCHNNIYQTHFDV